MDDLTKAKQAIEGWQLGATSARSETSGLGPATISKGKGDHGGVSYGTYQFSSNMGTLTEYLSQSRYKDSFSGLTPVTPAFDAKWRELATTDPSFGLDQHHFIQRTHYDPQVSKLKDVGIDLSDRGRAVQDALWSTSVQYRNLTKRIFQEGLKEKFGETYKLAELSDAEVVGAVQDYKIKHNEELFKNSKAWWPGLQRRAQDEKVALVELAAHEALLAAHAISVPLDLSTRMVAQHQRSYSSASGVATQELQEALNTLGYTDINGRNLAIDGQYGKRTSEAVEAFQREHGLSVDGIAGPKTLAALHVAVAQTKPVDSLTASTAVPNLVADPAAVIFPQMAPPDLDVGTIRSLQQNLSALGMTNHYGQPLPVTGTYDLSTRTAVMGFQHDHGLPGTGLADPATRALIEAHAKIAELQRIEHERPGMQPHAPVSEANQPGAAMAAPHSGEHVQAVSISSPGLDDPRNVRNPLNPLYTELKTRIPDASENRLLQFTAACHSCRITAENLGEIYFARQDGRMIFTTSWPPGPLATVDLKQSSPEPQQSIRHIQQHDQQQAQIRAEFQARQVQQEGPVLSGP